jgi:GntR family transcriptional regulator of vanillate catabolism
MSRNRSRQHKSAVRHLREHIIGGRFAPGERISELAAVDLLGMSRTPVRLALQTLAHEGLLEARSGGGFVVRDYSIRDMLDAIDLRGVLEGMAARLAAERSSTGLATRELRQIVLETDALLEAEEHDGDEVFEGYVELNKAYHAELVKLARSPVLERSLDQVTALPFASPGALVKATSRQDKNRDILRFGQFQHRALLDAITRGESSRASMIAQEHAQTAANAIKQLSGSDDIERYLRGSHLVRWEPEA